MRAPRLLTLATLLLLWFSPGIGAQEAPWKLASGPRKREGIPLPVLWASPVWEAVYEGPPGRVLVYGLGKTPFLLDGGEALPCPGVKGRQRVWDSRVYVHLPEGFLLVFPEDYPGVCSFLDTFRSTWERYQGVSYYKGGITLPPEIPGVLP